MNNKFESCFAIDEQVGFHPSYKQATELCIDGDEQRYGIVVSIRFTKSKVFYDCLCDYLGVIFTNVPSEKVFPIRKFEG